MNEASSLFRHLIRTRPEGIFTQEKIPYIIAWLVSIVFHPLMMPTFMNGIVFKYCSDLVPLPRDAKIQILFFIFITTYIVPSLAPGLLWVSGTISNISLEKRSERMIPLIITGLIYTGVSYVFLDYLQIARLLGLFMGAIALTVVITAVITHFWKISSHMVGIGGLLGFIIAVILKTHNMSLEWPLIGVIIFSGAVASSRLLLGAHGFLQIISGFFLGIAVSWSAVHFFV